MNKYIFIGLMLSFTALLSAGQVNASGQYGCTTGQYGSSCESVEVSLDKKVQDPNNSSYVDQLTINDTKFNPGQNALFQITVKNNGNTSLRDLYVYDTLPAYLDYVSSKGSYDANSRKITFKISELNPGQSQTFDITTKTYNTDRLPKDKDIVCIVNNAEIQYNGLVSSDNSQLCIQQKVLPAQTKGGLVVHPVQPIQETPSTGPGLIALSSIITSLATGLYIRRK